MRRLFKHLVLFLTLILTLGAGTAAADPVAPEEAFKLSAGALSSDTVEVRFDIRQDYYLYDSKLDFSVEDSDISLGQAEHPPGKPYEDEFFGETSIHRDELKILLPVEAAAGTTQFELTVHSQGCWDGGICYPPEKRQVSINLEDTAGAGGGSLLDSAIANGGQAQSAGGNERTAGFVGNESGRITGLLQEAGLPLVLVTFFGFGLLLAFTPCVFPMIPILSGIIIGQGQSISRMRAFVLSLAYVLGMAATYALAGVAAGMTGTMLTAALQNVWVLSTFAAIFVLLSLSMFGFYELQMPSSLQSRLSDTASHRRGGQLGSVTLMGVLSALIVGPCVAAPLAGALLYIAQTGDATLGGLALFVMALGMGAPLILVGVGMRSMLPRIGPWMSGVKKAFGVMLLGVAIWLVSPVVPPVVSMLGYAALLVFSGIFLRALDPLPHHAGNWQRFWKGTGVVMLLFGAAILIGTLSGSRDPLQPLQVLRADGGAPTSAPTFETVDSIEALDARLAETDRPVMLDFYADWCVSCKEMERFTFTDREVVARMDEMLLLKADVTDNTSDHKALLQRFDLFGPPGIIFFDEQGREINDIRVVGFMRSGPFSQVLDAVLN